MQKIIATNQTVDTDKKMAALIMRLTCSFWLMAKFIGWKVWIKDRQFPLVPVLDFFNWPSLFHYILFVCSIALILILVFKPFNKIILIALLIGEILSCLADQNRWQPWEYQYLFTAFIFLLNYKEPKKIVCCIAFMMAVTYLYSGIGKLNEGYLILVWDNIFLKGIFKLQEASYQQNTIHYLGYATAIAEVIFAAGLFFAKTKKPAAYCMIGMHLLILFAIGPLGINYNTIVWPWNVVMIILLYIIFIKPPQAPIQLQWVWQGKNIVVLICWGILPALNYAGLWDNYLSSRLYSGGLPVMAMCVKDAIEKEELESYSSRADRYGLCNGETLVYLQSWAVKEMNIQPYPEMRVYKQIEKHWRESHPGTSTNFQYFIITGHKQTIPIKDK